jgi:hypothetical protein
VLVINAAISALLMPLAYVTGRRLGLVRPAAYAVAAVAALLPAGLFYSEFAMTDANEPPGRMADRGLQPGRGLGRLAEILIGRTQRLHMCPLG